LAVCLAASQLSGRSWWISLAGHPNMRSSTIFCQAALYLIAIRDCQKTVETKWKHCFDAGLSGIDVERTDFGFGGLFDNDLGYSVRVRRSV